LENNFDRELYLFLVPDDNGIKQLHFTMKETRYRRYTAFGVYLFLTAPILIIGGISTALLTETKEEFELIYPVVFLGGLNSMALISLVGTVFRFIELRKYGGTIVNRSSFSKRKKIVPKKSVYVVVAIILFFSSFVILTTGAKLFKSIFVLIE
jgi:hypothetical protein